MVGNLLLKLKELEENEYVIIVNVICKEEYKLLKEVFIND